MSEEIKKEEPVTKPVEPEQKVLPSKEEITKMAEEQRKVEIANMEIEIPKGLKEEAPGETLYAFMIGLLKNHSGYPVVCASRIVNYDKEGKKNSTMTSQLAFWFKVKGGKSQEDFIKAYQDPRVVIIQLMSAPPTMAPDGMYDQIDIEGKKIKTIPCGVRFLADEEVESFKPTIIMRTGPCKPSEIGVLPNTLGMAYGDLYHKITNEELQAAVKQIMGEKAAAALAAQQAADAKKRAEEDAKKVAAATTQVPPPSDNPMI